MSITRQLFMRQTGDVGVLVFTATLITYNSYIVVSKNREMFQQKAMWKVVLAMLYGAHL